MTDVVNVFSLQHLEKINELRRKRDVKCNCEWTLILPLSVKVCGNFYPIDPRSVAGLWRQHQVPLTGHEGVWRGSALSAQVGSRVTGSANCGIRWYCWTFCSRFVYLCDGGNSSSTTLYFHGIIKIMDWELGCCEILRDTRYIILFYCDR